MRHATVVEQKLDIGLENGAREEVLGLLDALLADEFVLYTKTRNFHWNVVGPRFHDLHKFFEHQYEQLDGFIDEVAERSRALGGRATGSMKEFLGGARLKESTGPAPRPEAMLTELQRDHEALIRSLRTGIEECERAGDAGTADFMTGLLKEHEKMSWMLRSLTA